MVDLAEPIGRGVLVFECPSCSGDVTVESDAEYDNQAVGGWTSLGVSRAADS